MGCDLRAVEVADPRLRPGRLQRRMGRHPRRPDASVGVRTAPRARHRRSCRRPVSGRYENPPIRGGSGMTGVHVAGIGVTPFGKNGDTPLADLGVAAAEKALADAGLDYNAVGEVFTSSSMAPPQTGLKVAHRLGRTGIPVTANESASAGGMGA